MSTEIYLKTAQGQTIPLPLGEATVGRQPDNIIIIEGEGVSRHHARFKHVEGQVWLTDLGSANGTQVNDRPLTPQVAHILQNGDKINLGEKVSLTIYGMAASEEATVFFKKPSLPPNMALPAERISSQPQQPYFIKDKSMALVLEFLPALFGFLGVGWIYANQMPIGLMLFMGYLFWNIIAFLIISLTAGCGCIFTLPINLTLIILSVIMLNNHMKSHPEQFR